ncbi:helix-turn-helix domain-containing protein [Actinoplanes teichomyceticus]|uniref:Helix-turn-helix protein n=1 Tax=Actinoplanes teichomyceticus TaxID=1867 RepID=A0A561WAK1_ACTTI|nr:helix-turn-helix transcriptional regulator [Actinoplanes teichomyceticus]TWG20894.1 helix-turn-helix protein [Actinoplanes teichomyceticus]GIF16481.1 hypothetical protein Ate01nite_65130 [Actinoplanes teichomyceticus]
MNVFTLVTENNRDDSGLDVLRRRLQLAHQEARRPTYRMIGGQTGLSASTICRIFTARKPPAWDNLRRVLEALGIPAETVDETWHELWLNAENDAHPIPVQLVEGLSVPGREHCPDCGAWIADTDTHDSLHRRLDRLERLVRRLSAEQLQTP